MGAKINRFEEELLTAARKFLSGAETQPSSTKLLDEHGFSEEARQRGRVLIAQAEQAFQAERDGTAWNFITKTPEERRREALSWFVDTRWRRFRQGFVAVERGAVLTGLRTAFSPLGLLEDQWTLLRDLKRAGGERPAGAPPPKDTVLVELQGWWEHWRLLAQRIFRGRNDLLAPFGLTSGKAPPRLRGKLAQIRFGEGAARRDARFSAN
jgi:hypothetical protein